jgi:hypothetical protein
LIEQQLRNVDTVAQELSKLGVDVGVLRGDTYRDKSTVIVIPTRGLIHPEVVRSWMGLARPMNQRVGIFFVSGDEVGIAYNRAIKMILEHPQYSSFKHVLTLEDDNIVPASAHLLLLHGMYAGGYDAVGGMYHLKSELSVPMAFGMPGVVDMDGNPDMVPRDLTEPILNNEVVEVNGIACGCTLWKLDLFKEIDPPWFTTWTRFRSDDTVEVMTQDLYFCRRAKEAGKRFAVDTRVKVGHMDISTGQVF